MVRRGRASRQQRLLRTAIGVVAIVAVAALIANALGGGDPGPGELPIAQVSFTGGAEGESDTGTPSKGVVKKEADAITEMLNEWYQTAFVDPSKFGNGSFPTVHALMAKNAKSTFKRDIASLTIGDARTFVQRIEPKTTTADVTVYLEKDKTPRFATALVRFTATATQKQKAQPKISISQRATLHFEMIDDTWMVTYYTANASQKVIQPSPSGSPSP